MSVTLESANEICTSFMKCLLDFQTLISGVLAIIAAIITACVIWKGVKLPLEKQDKHNNEILLRQRQFVTLVLARDFRLLATRASMAASTIRVTVAANAIVTDDTRRKTMLKLNPIVDNWEFMSLLPRRAFDDIMALHRKVEDHNFDMERAGGSFGDDNFRGRILHRTAAIKSLALSLSSAILNNE